MRWRGPDVWYGDWAIDFADALCVAYNLRPAAGRGMAAGFVALGGAARLGGSGCGGGRAGATCAMQPVTFVTGNAKKLREVRQMLGASAPLPCELVSAPLDLPELQGSIEEIARAKCAQAAAEIDGPVLVEDTALVRRRCAPAVTTGGVPRLFVERSDWRLTACCRSFVFGRLPVL